MIRRSRSISQKIPIPTGYLFVGKFSKGFLETLSIGDYGKASNVKADFLGYFDEIDGVPSDYCKPLTEKWVITVSTQYGCPMKCTFCDVPNVKFGGNATFDDLKNQMYNALSLFPEVRYTERLNLHFARMGEPIFNENVFEFSKWLYNNKEILQDEIDMRIEVLHPVLSTMLPRKYSKLTQRILEWCDIKNNIYNGQAGIQFSINSTNEKQRTEMFSNQQLTLSDLVEIADEMPNPIGRKYCLNFAYATNFEIDAQKLASLFDVNKFMIKITPIHNNNACRKNEIETIDGYNSYNPYKKPEEDLKDVGFDVLVFVPSFDEEDGCVTCGNAILGGSTLKPTKSSVLKIEGLR